LRLVSDGPLAGGGCDLSSEPELELRSGKLMCGAAAEAETRCCYMRRLRESRRGFAVESVSVGVGVRVGD